MTEHSYDVNGNEFKTVVYANRISIVSTYTEANLASAIRLDEKDQYQFRIFDTFGRVSLSFDSLGYASRYVYDGNSHVISKIHYAMAFSLADLKAGHYPEPRDETDARINYFAYDGLNQERFRVEADGAVFSFDYDLSGQLIKTTAYSKHLPLQQMNRDFSLANIQAHLHSLPQEDQCKYQAYDQAGRLSYQLSAGGIAISYSYDGVGNLIATERYANCLNPGVIKDNWQRQLVRSSQDRLTKSVFDAAGREIYRISAEGRVLERRYDALGNVIAEIAQDSTYNERNLNKIELSLSHD